MKKIGIAVMVVGLLISIFTGISFKTEEQVVELGEFEITREKEHDINWRPWIGVAVIAAGAIIFLAGRKK